MTEAYYSSGPIYFTWIISIVLHLIGNIMKVLYIFPRRSILAFISSAFSLICNISTSGLIIYENIKNILISAEFILKVEYYPKQDLNSYEFRVNVRLNCIEMSTKVTAVFNYCQPIVLPIILAYRRIRLDNN